LDENELKEQFVGFLLQNPDDPFKAALGLFPEDTNRALRVAHEWPHDKYVQTAMKSRMSEGDDEELLPTKSELARKVWGKMNINGLEADEFAKLARLFGEIRGFIEKPSTTINANSQTLLQPVMVVTDKGTDDEWEEKLLKQQGKLLEASTGS